MLRVIQKIHLKARWAVEVLLNWNLLIKVTRSKNPIDHAMHTHKNNPRPKTQDDSNLKDPS